MTASSLARLGASALLICALAQAQHVTGTKVNPDGHNGIRFTVEFGGPPTGSMGAIITGVPYSLRNLRQRVFANGVRDPEEVLTSMNRDSLGRRRLDSFQFAGQYSTEGLRIVEIRDWVGQYEYTLDTVNRIAYRMKLPRTLAKPWQPEAQAAPDVRQNAGNSQIVRSLGQQTIEGFLAHGTLTTIVSKADATVPVSSREVWTSNDLEPAARIVTRDASGLQTTQSIASVSHDEPAADLFMIPPDYEIRDVDGPYSIVVTVPESSLSTEVRQQILKDSQAHGSSFGVATATFPVAEAAGKTVRFSGWIRTENVTEGYAGLWWRVDGMDGPNRQVLAFDNSSGRIVDGVPDDSMGPRGAKGTTPWTRYEFELPVPADATNINFGALLTGKGTAWFDSLQVDLNGATYRDSQFDFDFESPKIKGFAYVGASSNSARYKVALDTSQAHSGRQSLKMEFLGGPDAPATGDFTRPAKTIGTPLAVLDPALAENAYRSMDYATPAPINFVNRTKGPVDIYWLDYDGKRVLYKSALPSGTSWTAGSFVTHPWLAVATGTGERLAAFTISTAAGGDAIIEGRN